MHFNAQQSETKHTFTQVSVNVIPVAPYRDLETASQGVNIHTDIQSHIVVHAVSTEGLSPPDSQWHRDHPKESFFEK